MSLGSLEMPSWASVSLLGTLRGMNAWDPLLIILSLSCELRGCCCGDGLEEETESANV